jgi:hypothetical protein
VTNIRDGRVSRHVTVAIDEDGWQRESYEHVWKKITDDKKP